MKVFSDIDLSYLWISYLKNGERLICWNDGTGNPIDSWIICHPWDGEIIASSDDEDAAHELFAVDEIFYGIINSLHMNQDQLTPGLIDSIISMWPSTERIR